MTRLTKLLTGILVSFAMTVILTNKASAAAAGGNSIEPSQKKYVSGGDYCVHSDDFGSSTWLYNDGKQGFTVTRSTASGSRVTAYPTIFRGWQWGVGTSGDWPIEVSADNMPRADLTVSQTWKGTYDASFDIWFSTYPNRTTQANGAEIMILAESPECLGTRFGSERGRYRLVPERVDNEGAWRVVAADHLHSHHPDQQRERPVAQPVLSHCRVPRVAQVVLVLDGD